MTDGTRIAHLEMWGHWREDALARRVGALDAGGPGHLVVAVPSKLAAGKGKVLPDHPQILGFSELLSVRRVLGAVDRLAVAIADDAATP